MPGSTTRLALPYPLSSEAAAGPTAIQNLATALDNAAIDLTENTLVNRPAAAIRGRWFYATDVAVLYRDSGSAWRAVTLVTDSVQAAHIAAGVVGYTKLDAYTQDRLQQVGDLKHSVQAADHGNWLLADARNTILRTDVDAAFVTLMLALGYVGSDGTHIGLPDYRGRVLVGKGTHVDVDTLTDNDGLAVGLRRPRHKHTVNVPAAGAHTHTLNGAGLVAAPGQSGAPGSTYWVGGTAVSATDSNGSHTHATTVGPQTGSEPTDSAAYGVANIFIYAG